MRSHWLLHTFFLFALVACEGVPPATESTPQPDTQPDTAGGGGGGGVPVTGLLLNVQRPPDQVPFKSTLDEWKVVDPGGKLIFSHTDTPPPESMLGVVWHWRRDQVLSWSMKKTKLGENFYEIRMTRDEFSEDFRKGTFFVSDATAAELRNMSNLKALLERARLIILVGKQGQ